MELLFLIIWLNLSLCMIVLPFKTVYVNKNGQINQDSKEYNSTHFMNDFFNASLYTTLEMGNPPQKIKVILSYQDCGFKIGNAKRCINDNEYLSQYNKNKSTDFCYTDLYPISIYNEYGFDSRSHSAEDSIYFYKDLKQKKYESIKKVDFYLGDDTDDPICGVIGFKTDRGEFYCPNISFISTLKARKTIDNYNWIIKYNSKNEGLIAIGANMNDVISNFNENYVYRVYTKFPTSSWSFAIDEMIIGNDDVSYTGKDKWIELNNDFSFLVGNLDYRKYIHENYFDDLIKDKKCSENLWYYEYSYYFNIIECDKEKLEKKFIDQFPSITFINKELGTEIIFEGKELFTETKYKYFFNVMFAQYGAGYWVFGKLFFRKYSVMINTNQFIIQIYNNTSVKKKSNFLKYFLLVSGNVVLLVIAGVLCYFLGKNLNQLRKKKANELEDDDYDYEYTQKNEEIINEG